MRLFPVLVRKFIPSIALMVGLCHPVGAQCASLFGENTPSFPPAIITLAEVEEKTPSEPEGPQQEIKTSPTGSGQPSGQQTPPPPAEEKKPSPEETQAKPEKYKGLPGLFDLLHEEISREL